MKNILRTVAPLLLSLACGSPDSSLTGEQTYFSTGGISATGGSSAEAGEPSVGGSSGGNSSIATGGISASSGGSSGEPASTGGESPIASGGLTGAETGGKSSTGGSASGGSPSTGGLTGATTGGKSSTGGVSSTGGAAQTTGGVPSTGGTSSTGGKPSLCPTLVTTNVYALNEVVKVGSSFLACSKDECSGADKGDRNTWLPTVCDAACASCARGCQAPQLSSSAALRWSSHPDYTEKVERGWEVRVQLAEGCVESATPDGSSCAYGLSFHLATCTGSTEDCRKYDPRFEHCSAASAVGGAAPCRDPKVRATSPWSVTNNACP